MSENIYPNSARENCFAHIYCEIAMESYYNATVSYEQIRKAGYSWDYYGEYDSMNKAVVSTIVFSAMAIEAFINDYAAACLGDSDFYDNFDKLSLLGKFELIARFILKSGRLDKGNAHYCRLKSLVKSRNLYVHCKSKRAVIQGYSLDEIQKMKRLNSLESESPPKLDSEEVENGINEALDALKAIYDVAVYFDEYDSNIWAVSRLFNMLGLVAGDEHERRYKAVVFRVLGIKADEL